MTNAQLPDLGALAKYLGIDLGRADGDGVEATWTAGPHLYQPDGILHGGAHAAVVETLASVGAACWFAQRGRVVGVSNATDFLRPVTGGVMRSTATPVHRGRTQQIWDVETVDDLGRLVARGSVRLQNLAQSE